MLGGSVEIWEATPDGVSILACCNPKKDARSSVEQGWKPFQPDPGLLEQKPSSWPEMS